jgi:hypothetical protein
MKTKIQNMLGGNKSFDAFVATSDQHYEETLGKKAHPVDASEVCREIKSAGFRRCAVDVEHFNVSVFMNATQHLPFQIKSSLLYPHRIASLFSTVSRCMTLVRDAESRLEVAYQMVFVSRLDVIDMVRTPNRKLNDSYWWDKTHEFDVLGDCQIGGGKSPYRINDRFFFGNRNSMLPLEDLYDFFVSTTKGQFPEKELFRFFTERPKWWRTNTKLVRETTDQSPPPLRLCVNIFFYYVVTGTKPPYCVFKVVLPH